MRRNLAWMVLVMATALLQTTWLDAVRVGGALPDLTLLLVVYFGLSDGEERAMMTGLLGGLFQDVAENAVLGHNILCNVVLGYAVGRMATRLVTEHPAVKGVIVLCASLLRGLLYTIILYVQKPGLAAFHHIVVTVVPSAFYTALCAPVAFILLDLAFRRERNPLQGGVT